MPTVKTFLLPDLGEGLTDAELLTWLVKVGDTVTLNQIIAEVETAKASVELPSPYAGTVVALHAEEGTTVGVGSPGRADPGPGRLRRGRRLLEPAPAAASGGGNPSRRHRGAGHVASAGLSPGAVRREATRCRPHRSGRNRGAR